VPAEGLGLFLMSSDGLKSIVCSKGSVESVPSGPRRGADGPPAGVTFGPQA
jgi:hypothetical protein